MDLKITMQLAGGIPVFELSGDYTGDVGMALEAGYADLSPEQRARTILDFRGLRYINSSGIALLLGLITAAVKREERVDFCEIPEHLRRVLDLVGMTEYVRSYPTLADALEAAK